MKKFISILLVVMMLVSMIPATVFAAETATSSMSFASTAQRESLDVNSQVWKNAGIIFTNNKGSGSNVADYSNPVRIYQGSEVVIEHEAGLISQIVIVSNASKYTTPLETSLKNAGVTPTVSGNNVTINFTPAVESFTFSASAQIRFNSLSVTYEIADEGACTHTGFETYEGEDGVAATCTATGLTATVYCSNCNEPVKGQQIIPMLPHNIVDGVCEDCGAEAYVLVTDISKLHVGSQIVIVATEFATTISTTQGNNNRPEAAVSKSEDKSYVSFGADAQILTIEAGSEVGTYAFNTGSGYLYAAGGTENNYMRTKAELDAAGSWNIEITEDGIATIKCADTAIAKNWMRYNDNNKIFSCYGSGQKDIAIYILPVAEEPDAPCDHLGYETYEGDDYVAPDCTTTGLSATVYCSNCNAVVKEQEELPISHEGQGTYVEDYIAPTCTEPGETGITYCENCDEIISGNEAIPALGHNYEGGTCTNCGDTVEVKAEATYVFANYTAGTQYAKNEEHVLDDIVTMYTTDAHFTSQLRLYSSSSNNGYAIIQSKLPIKSIAVNAGNKVDVLQVYGSNDEGATWTLAAEISVTSTAYADYTAALSDSYSWLKLDVKGSQQIRIVNMTLQFITVSSDSCNHELTVVVPGTAATCTTAGKEDGLMCECGEYVQEGAVIEALGHTYDDDCCIRCTLINPEAAKQAEAIDGLPTAGDKVIFYHPNGKVAMAAAANGDRMGAVSVTKANGMIPYSATHTAVMTVEQVGDYYRFEMGGLYLTSGTTGNTLCFAALPAEGATDYTLWEVTADSSYGVFIRSVNAIYTDKNNVQYNNQTIEYYQDKFYPYGFNGTDYITSYRIQIGLVNKITLTENVNEINYEGKLYLDLNGYTAGKVTADELIVWDSSATATTAGTGSLTTECAVAVDNTVDGVRYIALKGDDGAYTFHVLQLKLSAVTLRTNKAGIYYKAEMACDEVLAGQIDYHGVAVSIVGMPTADFANEANTAATKILGAPDSVFTSGSITNIFRSSLSAEKNAARGEMKIYANPYLKLTDGTVLMGNNNAEKSMQDIMSYLNENFASLGATEQENVKSFYTTWADAMASWNLANLAAAVAPGEEQA